MKDKYLENHFPGWLTFGKSSDAASVGIITFAEYGKNEFDVFPVSACVAPQLIAEHNRCIKALHRALNRLEALKDPLFQELLDESHP